MQSTTVSVVGAASVGGDIWARSACSLSTALNYKTTKEEEGKNVKRCHTFRFYNAPNMADNNSYEEYEEPGETTAVVNQSLGWSISLVIWMFIGGQS